MVIRYSSKELISIGEMVIINELTSRMQPSSQENFQQEFLQFQQQLQIQLGHQIPIIREEPKQHESLTSSVAEFFRKAQQNFYAQASIDPTKVRRLSEIEAELVEGRHIY